MGQHIIGIFSQANTVSRAETESEYCSKNIQKSLITKEDAADMTDEELLTLYSDSEGHRGKDFKDYMQCDFSYTHLTDILQRRGYTYGWHKDSITGENSKKEVIIMKKNISKDNSAVIRHRS